MEENDLMAFLRRERNWENTKKISQREAQKNLAFGFLIGLAVCGSFWYFVGHFFKLW